MDKAYRGASGSRRNGLCLNGVTVEARASARMAVAMARQTAARTTSEIGHSTSRLNGRGKCRWVTFVCRDMAAWEAPRRSFIVSQAGPNVHARLDLHHYFNPLTWL